MQHVDDDMEKLFRRAAEGYSLNTNSGNFNEVLKKKQALTVITDPKPATKNNKQWLLLLLLIPFAWICNYNFFGENDTTDFVLQPVNIKIPIHHDVASPKKTHGEPKPALSILPELIISKALPSSVIKKQVHGGYIEMKQIPVLESMIVYPGSISADENLLEPFYPEINAAKFITLNTIIPRTLKGFEAASNTSAIPNTQVKKDKIPNPRRGLGLYAGILVSPDISTVKFQSIKNVGIGAGILVGFQVSKKISFESGIAWDKKFYYSHGEYANTDHIYLQSDAKLISLEGYCKMLEIPLNIKYNFKSRRNYHLSASGGLSSYIMKDETYSYIVKRNNYQYNKTLSYKNGSENLMAAVNVAGAYNLLFGKGYSFRVEPYVKLPLKGTGVTSIPIMSAGINVGVTKQIFQSALIP